MNKYIFEMPIIEISNKNTTTREITMLVHVLDEANANGLEFKEEYTKVHMNTMINKPVVCEYYPVKDDLGDHAVFFSTDGDIELRTIAIGTINNVWVEDYQVGIENKRALFAKATVWYYKYPQIVNCIENMYNSKNCCSSVEIEVYSYGENPTNKYRIAKDYSYLANCLLSISVPPADSNAGVINVSSFNKEVAVAVNNDLKLEINKKDIQISGNKGGNDMPENKEVAFNFGKEMNINFELSEMSHDDIRSALWNALHPVNKDGYRDYTYWVREVYNSYVIVTDWDSDKSYKMNYSISESENSATVDKESAIEVKQEWVDVNPSTTVISSEDHEKEINDLKIQHDKEINNIKEEFSTKETEVTELQTKIEELNKEISTKNESLKLTETESNEKIIKLGESIDELKTQISSLTPIKEQYEQMKQKQEERELVEKREVLKQFALNSKMIKEEEFENNEEIKNMIQEVNESAIKGLIADRIVEKAKIETNSQIEDVEVSIKEPGDLIPKSTKDEMYAPSDRK